MPTPDIIYEELFVDLHESNLWQDQKTIGDGIPQASSSTILAAYRSSKDNPSFDLKEFFEKYFKTAPDLAAGFKSNTTRPVKEHIEKLWPYLERKADSGNTIEGDSLIPLPHPYIVPGGRFNEIYYWDSYFTMLGLQHSGLVDQIEGMIKNFSYLIDRFGFIPNGNRTYFLGRSQPPFYALMIQLLAEEKGNDVLVQYLPQLKKEYAFWMKGSQQLVDTKPYQVSERVIALPKDRVLNRYFDLYPLPRQESYQHDINDQKKSDRADKGKFYLDIRSGCESGWDFSCRWFDKIDDFSTIKASEILPIDLNCLLYQLENTIAEASQLAADKDDSIKFKKLAQQRADAIQSIFWNESEEFYFDYNFVQQQQTGRFTLAAMFPLFFTIATKEQAAAVAKIIESQFLEQGGLVSTPYFSGQQWDAPNGWAPLQWIAVKGLLNYGFNDLAFEIRNRWLKLNDDVFRRTGKMMEKYNVVDSSLLAGGGEYKGQAGFGWTNGVYLKLLSMAKK